MNANLNSIFSVLQRKVRYSKDTLTELELLQTAYI